MAAAAEQKSANSSARTDHRARLDSGAIGPDMVRTYGTANARTVRERGVGPAGVVQDSLASFSISLVSAFSCFFSIFSAFFMARSILASMSETPTTIRPAVPASRLLAQLLEVGAAHAAGRVAGGGAERARRRPWSPPAARCRWRRPGTAR